MCLDVPTVIVEQTPFTSPVRGWTLRIPRITASPISAQGKSKIQHSSLKYSKRKPTTPFNLPENLTKKVEFTSQRKFILLSFLGEKTKTSATGRTYIVGQELTAPSSSPRSQLLHPTAQDQSPLDPSSRKD